MSAPLKNFLLIDIETASGNRNLEELSPQMKTLWEKKAGFIRNTEEKSPDELYEDRSAIYAEFGKVIVIGIGFYHEVDGELSLRVKSLVAESEHELLMRFKEFIEARFDQEELRLCAHNGKEFDFPYLCRRMLVNGISIPWVLNLSGKKTWEINHIDTLELWKFGDWKNFTSLELLCEIMDIPSSKNELDGSMVTKTYYEEKDGLKKIAEYCQNDVIATAQLYLKLKSLPLIPPERITIAQ